MYVYIQNHVYRHKYEHSPASSEAPRAEGAG